MRLLSLATTIPTTRTAEAAENLTSSEIVFKTAAEFWVKLKSANQPRVITASLKIPNNAENESSRQ